MEKIGMYEARLGLSGRPNRVYSYSLISLRLSSLNAEQKGYFLMLLLPTETTIEAVNVCTDRRHPFHTYNDRSRFIQVRFTQGHREHCHGMLPSLQQAHHHPPEGSPFQHHNSIT